MQSWKRAALIAASVILIVAMVVVWVWVDLGTADGTASVVGASAGVVGLAYALLSGNRTSSEPAIKVVRTGKATASGGGTANTGVTMPAASGGPRASAEDTGEAESDGSGDANTGIRLT
ncbi:hypothetical protein [Streptomyces nitrosporeus]|uniref:hypothetical protein n=1 Tax=Streptomyces nitrosporeus TaxID=28894 RepID=UPI00167D4BB1|nr:hypothetical protein [Streptomyces nitrosporeus]GGZ18156.1 hypothetical protein GCM10010327_56510 [Streptomyces nitrosporeus]